MYNVASNFLSKKFSGPLNVDQTDQKLQCCFVNAAIAFCKLQHLNPTVPVKTQVNIVNPLVNNFLFAFILFFFPIFDFIFSV